MRILLAVASLSGNTREVARAIRSHCEAAGHEVTWIETEPRSPHPVTASPPHDLYLLGSWTHNAGRTPGEMKRFIAELVDAVGKPANIALFGTGETQWGEDCFCGAVHRMARFFDSRFPRLLIEQMPHGEHDATAIADWTRHILDHANDTTHADHQRPIP